MSKFTNDVNKICFRITIYVFNIFISTDRVKAISRLFYSASIRIHSKYKSNRHKNYNKRMTNLSSKLLFKLLKNRYYFII